MKKQILAITILLLCALTVWSTEDILIADFEANDYGDWKVEGKAFGDRPAKGTLEDQMQVTGFEGKGLVNSSSNAHVSLPICQYFT